MKAVISSVTESFVLSSFLWVFFFFFSFFGGWGQNFA